MKKKLFLLAVSFSLFSVQAYASGLGVTVNSPVANQFVKGTVTVTGNKGTATSVKVNSALATISGTTYSATITLAAPDGAKTITVVGQKGATSQTVKVSIKRDATAPTTTSSGIDGNWHTSSVTLTLTRGDGTGSGIDKTYYSLDGSTPTVLYTAPVTISTSGVYTVKYYSVDKAGNSEVVKTAASQVKIDTTPPTAFTVTDDGLLTSSSNSLHAAWSASSDSVSGLTKYEYAIGTAPGITNVRGFTAVSPALTTSMTFTGLSLVQGSTYYITVRATNGAGSTTLATSDGIKTDFHSPSIASLNPAPMSRFKVGDVANLQAAATDQDGDPLLYQYSVGNTVVCPLGYGSSFLYSLPDTCAGRQTLKAEVQDFYGACATPKTQDVFIYRKPVEG